MTATVTFLLGNAERVDDQGKSAALEVGGHLTEGESVRLLDKTSRMVLELSDGTELRLKGVTEMKFAKFNRSASGATRKTRLELAWGSFWAKVAKLTTSSSRFEVKAGGVVCGVRGTTIGGWWDPDKHDGGFFNFEGNVYLDNGQGPQPLPPGFCRPFHRGQFGSQRPNTPRDSGQFRFEGNAGAGAPEGGADHGSILLTDLTGDLNQAVSDTRENNKTTGGVANQNAGLQIQLDGPEGYGGTNN